MAAPQEASSVAGDDLPDWLDPEPPDRPRVRGRLWILLTIAGLPWLVALALLVQAVVGGGSHRTSQVGAAGEGPSRGIVGRPAEAAPDDPSADPGDGRLATDDVVTPGARADASPSAWPADGPTTALAVTVARAWLTGLPPLLEVPGVPPSSGGSYAEHLVVEAVERPEAGAAVVTVVAVVLTSGDEDAAVHRLAVPITETPAGPRPAGPPWPLEPPELSPAPLVAAAADADAADHAAAEAALAPLALSELELRSLTATEAWPWVAHVRGTTADGRSFDGPVWLRRDGDGFALAGAEVGAGGPPRTDGDRQGVTP